MTRTTFPGADRPVVAPSLPQGVSPRHFVGIVLAGSYHTADSTFPGVVPRPLVPIAQIPLLAFALRWLAGSQVAGVKVCTNGHSQLIDASLSISGSRIALPLDIVDDPSPRGPAGSARDAALAAGADTFVVVEGTVIPVVTLQALLDEHHRSGAAMTAVVHHGAICRTADAHVATPAGIYVCSRRAFDHVAPTGFQDIKEHMIPALRRAGERVVAHVAADFCPRVLNAETYLAVNHWVIEQMHGNPDLQTASRAISRGGELLAHTTARVHPTATILGPTILGPGVSIGAGATIVGPTSIGAGTVVGEDSVVCRSVIWSGCAIERAAFVDHAVVADLVTVPAGATVHREVKMPAPSPWRFGLTRVPAPRPVQPAPAGSVADLAVQ